MEIFTIGFTRRSAADFFESLRRVGVRRLLDVRLNNTSQLAGFAKRDDLEYLLGQICGAVYEHDPRLAPTQTLLDDYRRRKLPWVEYEARFLGLMREREIEKQLDRGTFAAPTVLLCSEPTPEHCHRRLVLEYLHAAWGGITIVHL